MLIDESAHSLLKLVSDNGKNVAARLASSLNVSRQAASTRLRIAASKGLITKHGVGRGVEYVLAELFRVHQERPLHG